MGLFEILLIVLLVALLVGAFPAWPHSRSWGYSPVGIILVILLVVFLFRYL